MRYDLRGVLALFTLGGVFAYAFTLLLVAGSAADMPPWLIAVASMVVGHYFGSREGRDRADAANALVAELERRAGPTA